MAKRTKTKASNVVVPQSRDDATRAVARVGVLQRELELIETDMNDQLGRIKERAELLAAPAKAEIDDLKTGLRVWSDANRDALTEGGKRKHADLGTGLVRWVQTRAAVRGVPREAEKLAATIKTLIAAGLQRFVRTKHEVDREAILREPEALKGVAGLSVAAEGEDFVVEPYAETLSKEVAA